MNSEPNAPRNRSGLVGVLVALHLLLGTFCYQLPGWPVWVGVIYSQPALLAAWTALANHAPGPFRFAMSLILLSLSTLACVWSSYLGNDFVELSVQDIIVGLHFLAQFLCLLIPMLVLRVVTNTLRKTPDPQDNRLHRKNLSLLHLVGLMSASALAIGLWAMLLRNAELSDSDMFGRQYLLGPVQHGAIFAGLTLPIVLNVLLIFGQSRRISMSILILLVLALEIPLASAVRSLYPTVDFDLVALGHDEDTRLLSSVRLSHARRITVFGCQDEHSLVALQGKPFMLRIVTYNTHLLPAIALPFAGKRSVAAYRSQKIAKVLADYDVIGLSEVFDRASRRKIIETLATESGDAIHFANGPVRSGRHLTNSGLLLCSRFPISARNEMTYRSTSRYVTHGFKADSFAAKGALHVRLQVAPELELDCFLTHLESQSPAARTRQVSELCSFVEKHQAEHRPLLILGDFNIVFSKSSDAEPSGEYTSLFEPLKKIRSTEMQDLNRTPDNGPPGTSDALAEGGGARIDYILFSAAEPERTSRPIVGRVEHVRFLDEQVPEGSLSDHLAVSCELALRKSD